MATAEDQCWGCSEDRPHNLATPDLCQFTCSCACHSLLSWVSLSCCCAWALVTVMQVMVPAEAAGHNTCLPAQGASTLLDTALGDLPQAGLLRAGSGPWRSCPTSTTLHCKPSLRVSSRQARISLAHVQHRPRKGELWPEWCGPPLWAVALTWSRGSSGRRRYSWLDGKSGGGW